MSATPFPQNGANGQPGAAGNIQFTFVQDGGNGNGVSVVLVNTNTQNDISTINNGDVVDLSQVGNQIGIRAEIPGGASGVSFNLTGPFNFSHGEGSNPPYSLFGDIGTTINPWPSANLKPGNYTLSVRANGMTTTVSFQLVDNGGGSGDGVSVVLVNTNTQNDISNINNGDVIDLSVVGNQIGIRAEIPGGASGVSFNLTGPFNFSKGEGPIPPYSLFGDIGVIINPWPSANLIPGNYTLRVRANGITTTVSFQIISGTTANARDISPDRPTAGFGLPQIISIYPNPVVDDRFNVSFSQPVKGNLSYTIFDLTGKAVQFEEINGNNNVLFELRLTENVAAGMYYLKMKSRAYQAVWYERFIRTQ